MKIFDWLAASAVEEPEMPAKKIDSTTLICASPPGKCPTIARESFISRSVVPPTFIRFAVSRKNGTAEQDERVVGVERLLHQAHRVEPRLDRENRQAGERQRERDRHAQNMKKKKQPNRISAAMPGDSTAPVTRLSRR